MYKNRPPVGPLSPDLQLILRKIIALRNYTHESGFLTTRSEKEILAPLGAEDLAAVLMALSCEHLNFRIESADCGDEQCAGCGIEDTDDFAACSVAICEDCGLEDRRNLRDEGSFTRLKETAKCLLKDGRRGPVQ